MSPTKIRPPVKWHGGKHYLANRIIECFPEHHTYVEPFGGAASVLLNKPPSKVEVYNDLNVRISRFFRVVRERTEEVLRRLTLTPYSEEEFHLAAMPSEDEVEQACRDFVRWRLSFGGQGRSFAYSLHRVRRGMSDNVSGLLSAIDENLPHVVERIRQVQILSRPALEVISKFDRQDTLFYLDPPYLAETRASGSRDVYEHEMSEENHCELAKLLIQCEGKVILSGYPSNLYDELYREWDRREFELPNHASGSKHKPRKVECLWTNFALTGRNSYGSFHDPQPSLFTF